MQRIDTIFRYFCMACAGIAGILMLSLFVQLLYNSADAWREFGLSFIWSEDWDPYEMKFGALPHIAGTLLSTGMAPALAIPPIFQTPFSVNKKLHSQMDDYQLFSAAFNTAAHSLQAEQLQALIKSINVLPLASVVCMSAPAVIRWWASS